jgi:hypothetical protein
MNIEDNHLMRDVYENFIGKNICIITTSGFPIKGVLETWNGALLKIVSVGSGTVDDVVSYLYVGNVDFVQETLSK